MKGVQLTGHGGAEVLQYRDDISVPIPKHNEVLIRVSAAGVNNTDINTRTAWYSKSDSSGEDASWSGNALVFLEFKELMFVALSFQSAMV